MAGSPCKSGYHFNHPQGRECPDCYRQMWVERMDSLDDRTRSGAEALWADFLAHVPGLTFGATKRQPTLDEAARGLLHFTDSWAIGEARGCVSRAAIVLEAVDHEG